MKEEERNRGEDELEKDRGALAGSRRSQESLSAGPVGLAGESSSQLLLLPHHLLCLCCLCCVSD